MARRTKTSPFEDLIGVASRLPWWACVGLAILSYLVLGALAKPVAVTPYQPGQIGQILGQAVWKTLAHIGQFVVPIACLAAAVVSAVRRRTRSRLVSGVAQSRVPEALDAMSWREFELLVGESFRLRGYEVVESGGGGADGGVDLMLRKERETFLVQCKQWKAFKVGVPVVRELYGVMAAKGAAGGFVVTSGRFTEEASAFASGRNVELVDGPKLFGLIQQSKASLAVKGSAAPPVQRRPATPFAAVAAEPVPICPACSGAMVLRTARRGANAGSAFWGCSGYPACKGTRAMTST